MGRLKRD